MVPAPRDTMAECIRQLLELDDSSRQETLNSLSQYAELKGSNGPSCAGSTTGASGSSDAGTSCASWVPAGLGVSLPEAGAHQRSFEGSSDVLSSSWSMAAQMGSREAERAQQGYWSVQLSTPLAQAVHGDTHAPTLQALPPGPLMWDARAAACNRGFRPSPNYSAANRTVPNKKAKEEQQQMDSPSAGVAHRNGHVKGGRQIQTRSMQPAGDTSHSSLTLDRTLPAETASSFNNDKDIEKQSLGSYLNYLKQIDAGRILLARKINRLGFNSAAVLTEHYSAYGHVEHVFVPRSRSVARPQSNRPFVRSRPSGIGFVVMSDSQAVDAILEHGEVVNGEKGVAKAQSVAGETVHLQRFMRGDCEDTEETLEVT